MKLTLALFNPLIGSYLFQFEEPSYQSLQLMTRACSTIQGKLNILHLWVSTRLWWFNLDKHMSEYCLWITPISVWFQTKIPITTLYLLNCVHNDNIFFLFYRFISKELEDYGWTLSRSRWVLSFRFFCTKNDFLWN